ncbi:protein of unknown function [Pedococcus dokdonensis]|uniref:DUF4192 domain-containing protein n=1 Tax=Pedococcus dokdonensis TaxID=443156 RepID=A0A1H0MIG7_9MICO|nr:DUF4192 domain-containing protein [Pedococcus dokdonensis]SDO80243.1 protein of unknown function [Pedococcus dokdonensis]
MNPISLRSPGDVVAVLPYQLGYHPQDSLVMVALRDRSVLLVARLDLPPADEVEQAAGVLLAPLPHEDPDAVLLVAYETHDGQSRLVLDATRDRLVGAGFQVLDRVVVRGGRWFAVDCEARCCPSDGLPVPAPADTPGISEFVGLGVSPLPTRAMLTELVSADPERTPAVADALAARSTRADPRRLLARRFEALSLWAVVLGLGAPSADDPSTLAGVRPDQVALLVESLHDIQLRDALVGWLCPGAMPDGCLDDDLADAVRTCLPTSGWQLPGAEDATGEGAGDDGGDDGWPVPGRRRVIVAKRFVARLQHLVRAVPDEHAPPVLTVVANLAWWLGDGTLARACLERALKADPGYRLALLLEHMVDLGIRPAGPGPRRPRSGRAGHGGARLV